MNADDKTDVVRVEIYMRTDKVGSRCSTIVEVEREEWEAMDEEDRQHLVHEHLPNLGEYGYFVLEDGQDGGDDD